MCAKGCYECLRILMIIFNFLFVVCGLGLLGISLYFYFSSFASNADKEMNALSIALFCLMAIGGLTVIVGICGCCGAYHNSSCLLGTYFAILLLIVLAEIGGAAYGFLKKDDVKKMSDQVLQQGVKDKLESKDDDSPKFIDAVQIMLKCCGQNGGQDYISIINQNLTPPKSCCHADEETCKKEVSQWVSLVKGVGCSEKISGAYMIMCIVVMVVALIEILGIVFSIVLCCYVKNNQYEVVHQSQKI